jgi:hypothetical protein
MSEDRTVKSPGRRAFFRRAGVGIGAAGVAAAGLAGGATAAEAPKKGTAAGDYAETDHVKTAYRLARF